MIKNRRRTMFFALGTAAAIALSGCAPADESGESSAAPGASEYEPAELTFAIASAVIGPKEEVATFAVAEEMGYFAEENLTVNVVNTDGSAAGLQAVASGSADYTAADAGSILAAAQNGTSVVAIGGLVQNWPWQMATLSDKPIASAKDFKGKNIGVISLASGSATYARAFVNGAGLDADTDVALLPVGVGAQARAALESGQVDVLALYTQAYAALENEGVEFTYLENGPEFDGLRSITFAGESGNVSDNKEVFERLLRASYKAMLFSANNPEAAMQIGYKVFPQLLASGTVQERLDKDVNSLNAWLKTALPKTGQPADFANWGDIPQADWDATQDYLVVAEIITAPVSLDAVWNSSLLESANDFDFAEVVKQAVNWAP